MSADFSGSLNYRLTEYSLNNSGASFEQNSIIIDAGMRIISKLFLNLSWESAFKKKMTYSRILADISIHF